MTYFESLEEEMADQPPEIDPLADFEFAVFFPRVSNAVPHRGPYGGTDGLEWCKLWVRECVEDGMNPEAFKIRERPINRWRDIDVV